MSENQTAGWLSLTAAQKRERLACLIEAFRVEYPDLPAEDCTRSLVEDLEREVGAELGWFTRHAIEVRVERAYA